MQTTSIDNEMAVRPDPAKGIGVVELASLTAAVAERSAFSQWRISGCRSISLKPSRRRMFGCITPDFGASCMAETVANRFDLDQAAPARHSERPAF